MAWKKILPFVVFQFVSIFSEKTTNLTKQQQEVQTSIFDNVIGDTRLYWNRTLPDKNIRLLPLALRTSKSVMEMRNHYEGLAANYFPKNSLLEVGYSFARIKDTLEQSSSVKLKLRNAIFYDQRSTNEQYLNDVKTRYHAEAYEMSFAWNNTQTIFTSFEEWIRNITKGQQPTVENFLLRGMTSVHTTVLTFTGCWDRPKTSLSSIKTLKFKTANNEIEIPTFNAREKIGYYNDAAQKYEAIRLPYKNDEFAMAVVLPHQNHSLDLFRKFEHEDYRQLLERVNENYQKIEYSIPFVDSTMIRMNENGTSVNGDDPIICDDGSSVQETHYEENKNDFKPFYVDRPFGILIYEEKTKYILSYILVRNPTSGLSGYRKFYGGIVPREKGEFPIIRSYAVFY